MATVARLARAFGRFWLDFLFGDSPVLFPATLLVVGVAFALHRDLAAAVVIVPLLVIGLLAGTVYFGSRKPTTPEAPSGAREPD
jgi:hypothetical protein